MRGNGNGAMGEMGGGSTPDPLGGPLRAFRDAFATEGFPHGGGDTPSDESRWPDGSPLIESVMAYVLNERVRIIEEWCERSLTDPEGRGVVIVNDGPMKFYIGLDASVPFGTIHEYKSPPWDTEERA